MPTIKENASHLTRKVLCRWITRLGGKQAIP